MATQRMRWSALRVLFLGVQDAHDQIGTRASRAEAEGLAHRLELGLAFLPQEVRVDLPQQIVRGSLVSEDLLRGSLGRDLRLLLGGRSCGTDAFQVPCGVHELRG